ASASSSSSIKPLCQLQDPVDPADGFEGAAPILVAAFRGAGDFLACYSNDGPAGSLALTTRARPRGRGELVVEIVWPGLPNPVFVRATATRRRGGIVARLHADDGATRDFLVRMARGQEKVVHRRRQRR